MRKVLLIGFILILFYATPAQSNTQSVTNLSYNSISSSYNQWTALPAIGNSTQSESFNNTYWGLGTIHLNGTQKSLLNLTKDNKEISLTNDTLFRFAWYFESDQYDYCGFILYTPNNSYYIVSMFHHFVFGNGSTQAIYEFKNENTFTWYEHQVNLTALFLQSYGFLPQKITQIVLINAYFNSTGLTASNQQSYYDDFIIYSNQSALPKPNPPQHVIAQKETVNDTLISWEQPNTTIGNVGHYNVYRSTSPNTNYTFLGNTTALNYTDTNQNSNQSYYYAVQSYNIFGNSSYAQEIFPTTQTGTSSTTISSTTDITNPNVSDNFLSLNNPVLVPVILATGATSSVATVTYTKRRKSVKRKVLGVKEESDSPAWYVVVILVPILGLIGLIRSAFYQLNTMQTLEHPLRREIIQILEVYEFDHLNSLKLKTNSRIATLLWHLNELEKLDLIEKKKYHQYTIIYLKGRKPLDIEVELYISMKSEKSVKIIDYLLENQSTNIKHLATEFNLKPSVIKGVLYRFIEMQTIKLQEGTGAIMLSFKWKELFKKVVERRTKELGN